MKKTTLTLMLIISAIFSLLGVESQDAILAKGNIWPISSVIITFPENDRTYYSSTLTLRYHASFAIGVDNHWIVYNLDGAENGTIYDENGSPYDFNGSATLSALSAGQHYIEIYSKNASWTPISEWGDAEDKIYFTVFTSPHDYYLSLHSPQNGTYYLEPVLLNFTRFGHFPVAYNYLYAVDGQSIARGSGTYVENIQHIENENGTGADWDTIETTTIGYTYLSNLTEGAHKLTFCSLRYGEVYSDFQTVYFNINNTVTPAPSPAPSPEPTGTPEATSQPATFPATLIFVGAVGIALAAIGLFVYFKKRPEKSL